jgi:peptide-methionine (R)-S-oxide reductase
MKPAMSITLLALGFWVAGCGSSQRAGVEQPNPPADSASPTSTPIMSNQVIKTEDEWKKLLTPEEYRVLRQKGTERAFTGKYWNTKGRGTYHCAGCGEVLFDSVTKYDSGCGWPSFYAPSASNAIAEAEDRTLGMARTEVMCARCGGHLGHVFEDGPQPTGLRYCINSVSIKFEPKPDK